jgi:hypothetical protein
VQPVALGGIDDATIGGSLDERATGESVGFGHCSP